MIKIAIVEDEEKWSKTYLQYLNRYVSETHETITSEFFANGMDFISDYNGGFDIILMDIAMPHMDGLEAARRLRAVDSAVCLIYVTTLSQYAVNGYEVGAFDFLVKPVGYDLFKIKLTKAISSSVKIKKAVFPITVANGMRIVPISEITHIESNKHYLYFHTAKEEYKMRGLLDDVKEFFLENHFATINRSLLVNLAYVEGYTTTEVTVAGEEIPLSRVYKADFLDRLARFMGEIA